MPSILRKFGAAVLAASLFALWPGAALAADPATAVLKGHVTRRVRLSTRLDRVAPDENVSLSLVVQLDQDLMNRTLDGIYGPNAPRKKRFLGPGEFAQTFDLARKRKVLKDYARAHGLRVDPVDEPDSQVVKVSGPARLVEKAFGVQLNHYRSPDGQVFRAVETDPVVPAALAADLHAVIGLSNYAGVGKPHLVRGRKIGAGAARAPSVAAPSIAVPSAISPCSLNDPVTCPGSGPGGTLAPADIKSIYGLTLSLTGTGQSVALMELDGYATSDITAYEENTQLFASNPNTTVTPVEVDNQPWDECGAYTGSTPYQNLACNSTTYDNGNGDGGMAEVALDIDMALSLASGVSSIRVYTALNSSQGILDAYALIASDNVSKSVSTSWGLDEIDEGGAFMTSEASTFEQMAANGQTIYAAAGDSGAYDASGVSGDSTAEQETLVTDDPASQPYVSGVGGTTLTGSLTTHGEEVWNEGCTSSDCSAGAGGGGIANYCENSSGDQVTCGTPGDTAYFALPSWQSGVSGEASTSYRNVPDVTLNADPNSFPYCVSVAGNFYYIGGTSAAAPLWAALTALINENRATGGYGTLGFANPSFYELGTESQATYFNDITSGNNGHYNAGTGYDNASGWGSFKGNALVNILSAPLAPTSAVTGLTSFTLGVSSIQYTWSALSGATGYDVAYATNSSVYLAHAVQPPYKQTGLIGDEVSGITVYGENDGTEGPANFITTATYAAAPVSAPTATGQFSSSATFSYSSCPASPSPSFCSGYSLQVSPNADFSGTSYSSSTPTRTLTTLTVTGLSPLTGYFMRLANLNSLGAPSYGPAGTFNTGTNLVAPVSPTFSLLATNSLTFGWGQSTNPNGTTYVAEASTAANYSGTLLMQTGTALSAAFSGLTADTSYYFRVQGVGGPFLDAGPEATLAAAPAALATSFSGVGATGLTLSWSGANDQPDTLYQADVSPSATFSSGVTTLQARSPTATFGGLTANTQYYARVEAIGRAGGVTAEVPLGSTTTLVTAPTLPAQPFSGLTTSGFTFAFNATDPAGTIYVVRVSTDPGFSVINAQTNTTSASASFTGLLSNQSYTVEVAALNLAGSPSAYAVSAPTSTFAAAPLAAAVPVTGVTSTRFGFAWSAGTLAPGTTYLAEVSSSPVFSAGFVLTTSTTPNTSVTFSGLSPNTTYYGQVQVQTLNSNPNGPFLAAGSAATLAVPPSAAAVPFLLVDYTSAAVAWTALPLTPQSAAAEGYLVQFDTAPDFSGPAVSSAVAPGAATAVVSGLNYATPYYARVGALNWAGLPDYYTIGSTVTLQPPLSSGTVATSGITLTVPPAFTQVTAISVFVPPGSFPAGTPISAVANLVALPPPVTNEASAIVPFGANVGLVLNANGLQPNSPVTITMAYDPAQIPAGQSASRLQLWRYDPLAQQWTLVPSQVDTAGHVLTAQTPHFSTFAPFFVAAGSDVSSVQVWPQPWELGDASSQYWSSVLNFSNLPPSADVKIFTIMGELVWSGTAAADGTLSWNGNNRFGRRVASGTLYAVFQNGRQTKTRRLVIIR